MVRPAAGTLHRYADGHAIARQGARDAGVWSVVSGQVRLEVVSEEGREAIVAVVAPGEAFGLTDAHPAPWTAIAVGAVEVLHVGEGAIDDLAAHRPAEAASLIRGLLSHQATTTAWLGDLAVLPLSERLASRLGDLAHRIGTPTPDGHRLPGWLTQERIGHAVGATRESVNRALRVLVRRGAVRGAGRRIVAPPPADASGGPAAWTTSDASARADVAATADVTRARRVGSLP